MLLSAFYFSVVGLSLLGSSKPGSSNAHEPITTKVRFNKEVVRILDRNCNGCHNPASIAPSLMTYEDARPWAKAIKEELLERRMPPWHAVKGYGEFSNRPSLTQHEIDVIVSWVEGGAPRGEDKDLPPREAVLPDWPLGKPDLVLQPADAVTVKADHDDYRFVSLPGSFKEDRWLSAIDLKPGDGRVVHCATIFAEKETRQSRSVIATWMPGQKRVALPEGVARQLAAGSRLSVKIHYRGIGEEVKDSSSVGLYFARTTPAKQTREIDVTNPDVVIPPGASLHRVTASYNIQEDTEAIALRPRAHPLVVSLQATAYRPDGSQEVLIWTRGYRFDWQPTYYLKRTAPLAKGTRVEVVAYFDNSEENAYNPNSPPKQVRWGDLTSDPLFTLVVTAARASTD
ncbi:MAG TPA: cytochrome c [Blastocatellia bacterium]|nr:cytochrome c [Blastocatellia bacterium]